MKETVENLYRQLSVDVEAEPLAARVKGAQAALKGLTPRHAVGLAILTARGKDDEAAASWLRERMEAAGESIGAANKQELGILAAAVLLQAWSTTTAAATAGALALQSAAFLAWRSRIAGLEDAASRYLHSAALLVRQAVVPTIGQGSLTQKPEERYPDGEGADAPRVRELYAEVQTLRSEAQAAVRALSTTTGAFKEQSAILWWLFGERFSDGVSWSQSKEAARPLRVASDLAGMTGFIPGPVGSGGFLRRALRDSPMDPDRKLTISGAVRELEPSVRSTLDVTSPNDDVAALLPILAAIHGVRPADGARPGGLQRSALQLSEQLYRELLLQMLLHHSEA